jgi:hypothetical protein
MAFEHATEHPERVGGDAVARNAIDVLAKAADVVGAVMTPAV